MFSGPPLKENDPILPSAMAP